jgi:Na+/melibiose symporter-like transporter
VEWKRRRFGRRLPFLLRTVLFLSFIVVLLMHLSRTWSLTVGVVYGGIFAGWMLLPQLLMPRQIFYWQMGASGEQKTAGE